jgi:two-component system, OmpR family, sensor histidine kinase KdpD
MLKSSSAWLRRPLRYVLAPILVALTTLALKFPFQPLDPSIVALLYLLPVLMGTLLSGPVGGMGAAFLSFLAFNYFFLPPYNTFAVANPSDTLALFVFLGVAGLVSYLLGRARAEAERARQREHETHQRRQELTILYELSKAISGQVGLERMLQTIAERVQQSFPDSRCEIWLRPTSGALSMAAQAGAAAGHERKPFEVLVRSEQEALGILKLYSPRANQLQASETFLLHAIAAQTAIVIERSRLLQTETRARVLEESDRLKSAVLSSVSHDLRTPLATIKAAVTGLLRRDLLWDEESTLDQLNAINEETDRLNQIISNLLSMSRIEAGALQLQKSEYALPEVLDAVLRRLARRTQSHKIVLNIAPGLPPPPLDHAAFEQIMTNLLDNAVKYSEPGSEITIGARQVGSFVEIGVSDHGRGIAAEAQQAVFDKFYRANNSAHVAGSGLGLSIVKGFVEAHGGKAWISSHIGEGTSVKFLLPLGAEAVGTHE